MTMAKALVHWSPLVKLARLRAYSSLPGYHQITPIFSWFTGHVLCGHRKGCMLVSKGSHLIWRTPVDPRPSTYSLLDYDALSFFRKSSACLTGTWSQGSEDPPFCSDGSLNWNWSQKTPVDWGTQDPPSDPQDSMTMLATWGHFVSNGPLKPSSDGYVICRGFFLWHKTVCLGGHGMTLEFLWVVVVV